MSSSANSTSNIISNTIIIAWVVRRFIFPPLRRRLMRRPSPAGAAPPSKPGLFHKGFADDLRYLTKVCFPSITCRESMLSAAFMAVLLIRTLLSLVVAELDGYLMKHLVNKNKAMIVRGTFMWLAIALPASFSNALIRYLQQMLALSLRERLNNHVLGMYFKNDSYYKLSHHLAELPSADDGESASSPGDKKKRGPVVQYPPNTEQAVTEGITQWADRFADVISSLGKPLFDTILFTGVLMKNLGWRSQVIANAMVWESGALMAIVRPNYSQMVQTRNELEGKLRSQHTRMVTSGEEIAFYGGEKREKEILETQFQKILTFQRRRLKQMGIYQTFEDFLTKYAWTVIGIVQIANKVIAERKSTGDNAKFFISMRRVMARGGDATERLIQGIKDIGELAGYTKNLMNTIHVLRFLNQPKPKESELCDIEESEDIVVKDLPLLTPAGDVLIDSMNLDLSRNDRLLILGPNGCGKSTLFRVLCGLWNAKGGSMRKPANRTDLLFLPQRPYMVLGTLLDQVTYPLTAIEALARCEERHGSSDIEAVVMRLIGVVDCVPLVEMHGGLQTEKDWNEVLSGGEKQRIGLARVLFHRPKYAVLDECNSTINIEAEQRIFDELVSVQGMGLVTISHRHSLFKYHNKFLTYDGCGGYTYQQTDLSTVEEMDGKSKEKINLVTTLMEICKDLGESWPVKP